MFTTRGTLPVALGLAGMMLAAVPAAAQQTYGQTIYWGSGMIDVPTAWVSPVTGDFAVNYSGKRFQVDPNAPAKINYNDQNNSQLIFSLSLFRRLELGWAAYSANPEWGFFGRGLLLDERDFAPNGGIARFIPSVAVGMRNVGPYKRIDRFAVGYDMVPPPPGGGADMLHEPDSLHQNFNTANTVYGVASKDFSLRDFSPGLPDVDLGLTVGYGNGLFSDDGGLGTRYAKHATGGLFYGAKADFNMGPNLRASLMGENNAWDWNAGLTLNYRGIIAGAYLTEIGAGSAKFNSADPASYIYNYQKFAFSLGWQSNVFALLRGNFLQSRVAELERQRNLLLAEIARRQQRIASLELEINRFEAQNLLELEQRRAAATAELRAEREALERLEERLRRVEQQLPPSSTPPAQPTPQPQPTQPPTQPPAQPNTPPAGASESASSSSTPTPAATLPAR